MLISRYYAINQQSLENKYDALAKCSKDLILTLLIHYRVANYVKYLSQNKLQIFENGKGNKEDCEGVTVCEDSLIKIL